MKDKSKDKWTVTTKESEKPPIPGLTAPTKVFTHSLKYDGKKVHSLTGYNGLTILTDTAREFNAQGYTPIFNSTVLLHELSRAQRKKLDDLCAKSVPDLFPVESEVKL
jgi:hypothetical protein